MATNYLLYSPLTGTEHGIPKAANSSSDLITLDGKLGIGRAPNHNLNVHNPATSGGGREGVYVRWTNYAGDAEAFDIANWSSAHGNPGTMFINRGASLDMLFRLGGAERVRFKSNGHVGIGTTSPDYPLEVAGTSVSVGTTFLAYHQSTSANTITVGNNYTHTVQMYCARIGCQYVFYTSDLRIKTNIQDIQDDEALVIFRKLKPKKYNYIDKVNSGNAPVYGFIAQEVKDVLPDSTILDKKYIPNIYEVANVSQNVVTLQQKDTSAMSVGTSVKLIQSSDDKEYETKVTEIIDSKNFKTETALADGEVFVYGTKIDDFHKLKKDAIWTIATAALQEVDRQLQTEKAKVSTLETKVSTLETELAAIKAHLNL